MHWIYIFVYGFLFFAVQIRVVDKLIISSFVFNLGKLIEAKATEPVVITNCYSVAIIRNAEFYLHLDIESEVLLILIKGRG